MRERENRRERKRESERECLVNKKNIYIIMRKLNILDIY